MKTLLNKMWNYFLRDPDIYITVIVAILTCIFSLLGKTNSNLVLSLVLATIALISLSLLRNREEDRKLQKAISEYQVVDNLSERFLKQEFDISREIDFIKNAEIVYLLGMGFTVFTPVLHDYLSHGMDNIPEIKILFMSPKGDAVKIAAFRAGKKVEELISTYEKNLAFLDDLINKSNCKLEYRVIDYLPPYNIIAIDPHLPKGRLMIRLAAWRAATAERPVFELENEKDSKWFKYFVEQFSKMWEASS